MEGTPLDRVDVEILHTTSQLLRVVACRLDCMQVPEAMDESLVRARAGMLASHAQWIDKTFPGNSDPFTLPPNMYVKLARLFKDRGSPPTSPRSSRQTHSEGDYSSRSSAERVGSAEITDEEVETYFLATSQCTLQ